MNIKKRDRRYIPESFISETPKPSREQRALSRKLKRKLEADKAKEQKQK